MDLNRKAKGDLAELKVATDLRARGYKIAFPYIPAVEPGTGMTMLSLRVGPTMNGQVQRVHMATRYTDI